MRFRKSRTSHLFILGAVLLFFSSFIYLQTRERINLVQKDFDSNKQQLSDQIPLESPTDKKLEDTIIKTNPPKVVENDREREIWCEQRDYEDLSSHPIFSKFNEWSEQFISLQCTDPLSCQDHDPRFVSHLIHKGKKLAQERSTILHKIIRGDPRKALELAFSQELLDFLPPEISEHMEVWETDFVDIVSIHRCFDPLHPNGWISRHAKFSDGRELRAWTYGRRKNLPSAKGISVWGIVLGEDFAVSENDAQVINYSAQSGIVRIAKKDISYETLAERNFVLDRLQPGKRRVKGITSYHYPLIMGSGMTAEKMLEMKYELNSTRVTFQDALNAAMAKNGKLLQIDDADESELLTEYLKNKYEEGNLTLGLTGSGDPVTFLWLGATDNEDTNGTLFDVDQNLTTQTLEINASEGDWKWLSGDPWNSSYAPWMADSTPSDNDTKDFAAFDWNHSEGAGSWTDMNENATLPFIIEYDTQMASQQSDLKGIRKILVIPARFLDESTHYLSALGGSNQLITNELGEIILEEYQQDSYEPITQDAIDEAMAEIVSFYSRNTDGELQLVPVVSPVVTLPLNRYYATTGGGGPSPYDSEGSLTGIAEVDHTELGELDDQAIDAYALLLAANLGEKWNRDGWAFMGLESIEINSSSGVLDGDFKSPPTVELKGGEALMENGSPYPDFVPASVEALTNHLGQVTGFNITEPGSFYDSDRAPKLYLNGQHFPDVQVRISYLLVSYVILSNYSKGALGLGYVGGPGSHVMLASGTLSRSTTAHEVGHNFGLQHAQRYNTKSEIVLSDDADQTEYGNKYSVMGTADDLVTSGDITVPGKVMMNLLFEGTTGYVKGKSIGVDVAELDQSNLFGVNEFREQNADRNNTFRIYRSNQGTPPASLRTESFQVRLPPMEYNLLEELNVSTLAVKFEGTGEEANATFDFVDPLWSLNIFQAGRGYASEPVVQLVHPVDGDVFLSLAPEWIEEAAGTDYNQTAKLLDNEKRWVRGICVKPNAPQVKPFSFFSGYDLMDYYLSYRTDISEYGIALNIATDPALSKGVLEPFLLDSTPQTPQDYSDAALLIGSTYSDYDSDLHFTPVKVGGVDPMTYVEVVIHSGTIEDDLAKVPDFELVSSETNPALGEQVRFSIVSGNATKNYAYSWFLNEQALNDPVYLNQSSILLNFTKAGNQVLRVVVSDMKGGVSSRSLLIEVGDNYLTNLSSISGTVLSKQSAVQGARVILEKASVIEHNVSITGNIRDSFYSISTGNPAKFLIDGETAPELNFRRGEIHRFNFKPSADGLDMSFLEQPENRPPKVLINMLSDARVDLEQGDGYFRNPSIKYNLSSSFSPYKSKYVGSYLDMLKFLFDKNGTIPSLEDDNGTHLEVLEYLRNSNPVISEFSTSNLVTRPFARTLMLEGNISSGRVGPREITEIGYYAYGGKGYDRDQTPIVEVRRSSIWEDYLSKNANATAFVDGVGTITPVISTEFMGNTWETRPGDSVVPSLVVWGSGGNDATDPNSEVNTTITRWSVIEGNELKQMGTISILNQGKGFEPNSTMAVLHYPLDPVAYWSFDRHESLFEDSNRARHQPSPAWNLEPDQFNLKHYWKLDENQSGKAKNEIESGSFLSATQSLRESSFVKWGLLGKALEINSTNEITSVGVLDENFTLSMWVKPEGDFNIEFSSVDELNFTSSSQKYFLKNTTGGGSAELELEPKIEDYWTHIGIVREDSEAFFFVDGRKASQAIALSLPTDFNITTFDTSVWVDEVRIYGVPLSDGEMRYLSGRTYLDISGNKYHAAPLGNADFLPISPENVKSDDESVPTFAPYPKSTNGSGRLGDSFAGELNGLSLKFDGSNDYLDISTHSLDLGLPEGTFSLWVNTTSTQSPNPLFWSSSPPIIDVFTDTETNQTEITLTPGKFFGLELANGLPRLAGSGASSPSSQVNDGKWHHIVASFPTGAIWVDGEVVATSAYDLQDTLYDGFDNLFAFPADTMTIGKAKDRTIRDQEIYFNGRIDDFIIYDRILTQQEVLFLFEMRRGREQLPRLEAVVDAIGTVQINDGGEGYRENPDLVFWYGEEENKTDLDTFPTLTSLEGNFTETNGTMGMLAYVQDDDSVYSYHLGKTSDRNYTWKKETSNGWRRLIEATGIGEFENASVGEIVWAKKMDTLTAFPLPDGREVTKRYIDYVTMDVNRSHPLDSNATKHWPNSFYQPYGLYGFNERVNFIIDPPIIHNTEAIENTTTTAYAFYFIDPDANESITISDPGLGITDINKSGIRIVGSGYQPKTGYPFIGGTNVFNQTEEDYPGFAEINSSDSVTDYLMPYFDAPSVSSKSNLSSFMDKQIAQTYGMYNWSGNEDVNVSTLDFNQTFSHVSVTNAGFGYSMPVELKVIRGLPQVTNPEFFVDEYNSTTSYVLTEAKLSVKTIGPNGEILDINIDDNGSGYINYGLLDPDLYQINKIPNVSVTGGGGRGAQIFVFDDNNDTVIDRFQIMDPGIGYFNIDGDNEPIVKHSAFSALPHPERNATLEVRLGGYLKSIPRCTACAKDDKLSKDGHTSPSPAVAMDEAYSHVEPWIEIWDRGRSETDIDANEDRAHGAVKVVKGEIGKVVVTKSGRGYIDPVAIVRDVSPKNKKYYDLETLTYRRKWKCTFPRTTEDGKKIECGHIHWGLYPPEECPGETDELFKYEDENGTLIIPTADQVTDWQKRHNDLREHLHCTENETHLNASFLVRKCWGTKFNYILYNDAYYRNPREDWLGMDANLSVIAKAGKIREIQVDDNGSNYYASTLYVEGSGSGVDAIFVFDEYGKNTEIIFNDPKLKNLEFDHIPRPEGAGQGFQERPWSWDENPNRTLGPSGAPQIHYINMPFSLYPETLSVSVDYSDATHIWFPGRPVLADTLGDRISSIEVTEPGLYNNSRDLSSVTIEFNSSVVQDIDGNGSIDFIQASALGFGASRLTHFALDDNATYQNSSSGLSMEYGLFDETPSIMFLDNRNFYVSAGAMPGKSTALSNFDYEQETKSSYIRLNDVVDYEADSKKSFIDLYVDDLFPAQLFYGNGILEGTSSQVLPAMGNRILVSEAVPGLNWAIDEPTEKASYSYTDIYGQYHFGNLEPGMYNLTVFMEDKNLQETTFRPRTEPTRITKTIYVPGFPELTLESDNLGKGISSLVWSLESRNAARPNEQISSSSEFFQEFYGKKLEGVGRGFDPEAPLPELTFLPHEMNLGKATPNLDISLSSSGDGSLDLQIIDDENTTTYFPGDKFTIVFNSVITGVDFFESYLFSDSDQTYNHGTAGALNSGQSGLVIYPSDAGGVNPIEVPLSSDFRGDQPFNLNAVFFEDDGTMADPQPTISWEMEFDFNSSDGNLSRLALFEDFSGNRDATMDGEQVKLLLYSTLRKDVGSIMDLEILGSGEHYENGDRIRFSDGYGFDANITVDEDNNNSVTSIEIIERGFGISEGAQLTVWDKNLEDKSSGTGLSVKKVFHSGLLKIIASTTDGSGFSQEVLVRPSSRNSLSSKEKWLDKYLDSFMEKDATWWENGELDDGLTNLEEWSAGTNPDQNDTDLDNISDGFELNPVEISGSKLSNPLMYDTDGDGWSDYDEDQNGTDPRSRDTDQDGIIDSNDLDPTNPSGDGVISGRILKQSEYGDSNFYIRYAKSDDINGTAWRSTWVGQPTSYYLSGLTDGNWTVQAYVDLDGDDSYTLGEPFRDRTPEGGLINGKNIFGLTLIPQDPSPVLYFIDENNSDDTENGIVVINSDPVDVNDTVFRIIEQNITIDPNPNNPNNSNQFKWGVGAFDPLVGTVDGNITSDRFIWFEVDGNLTEYLTEPYDAALAEVKLDEVPVGMYQLTYKARDEFNNYAPYDLIQNIFIQDTIPPYISLLFLGGGVTNLPDYFEESNNLTNSNSSAVLEWNITDQITFSDQLSEESDILIQLFDQKNHFDESFESQSKPDWNVTVKFSTLSDYNYSEVEDINLTFTTQAAHSSSFQIDASEPGTYKLEFFVSDQSGNVLEYDLYIILKPGVLTEITAVDGYLSNATVIFDANGDGLSDLNRNFYTNTYGRAQIILSKDELQTFDLNGNGRLDANEGKFIVIGGIDTSTGTKFSGKLIADVNSTVVSPLTTLVSKMMDLGATKDEAIIAVALALELDSSIDLMNYDPIQQAFVGDQRATTVMMANLRMANLVNQVEGLLLALSETYQGYEVGANLLGEIAKGLDAKSPSALILEDILVDALPVALASVGTAGEISLEDQLTMFQLMADLDQTISAYEEDIDFASLMDEQRKIIADLENLFTQVDTDEQNVTLRTYQLQVSHQEGGVAGDSGSYSYGSKVEVYALAEEGHIFDGWEGDGVEEVNESSTFIIMTKDRSVLAKFKPLTYEVSITSSLGGRVEGAGTYTFGESIQLSAIPDPENQFLGWIINGEDWGEKLTLEVPASENLWVAARFSHTKPVVELTSSSGGYTVGDGNYEPGEKVHIQAIPNSGYVFTKWTGIGAVDETLPSVTLILTENLSVHAEFLEQPPNTFSLAIESIPSQGGYHKGTGAYGSGERVPISASPLPGYTFEQWTGSGVLNPLDSNTSVLLTENTRLEAKFAPIRYQLTMKDAVGGVALGAGNYPNGTEVNLSAIPQTGYKFIRWNGEGITNLYDSSTTLKIEANVSIEPIFEAQKYFLQTESSKGGIALGQGYYEYGQKVEITAVPSTGYKFTGWQGEGISQADLLATTIHITSDITAKAQFAIIDNYFTPYANDFSLYIDHLDFEKRETLHILPLQDGDGDLIKYSLFSGNIDKDSDGEPFILVESNGSIVILDPEEIIDLAGTSLSLIISLDDQKGKASSVSGLIRIADKYILESAPLGDGWFESPWFGHFLKPNDSWIYHLKLGWIYIYPLQTSGYWLWDPVLEEWLWTDSTFFPWTFSNKISGWIYFSLDSEKVRFFNHNSQEWLFR